MRLRRFALVAFAVTGGAMWISMLACHRPIAGWYPLAGLIVAMIAASTPYQPSWASRWPVKLVLGGCVSFAVIGFAVPFANDLHINLDWFGAWIALMWLLAVGALAVLTIVGCRAWQAYLGTVIAFASLIPSMTLAPFEIFAAMIGITLCALPTLLSAAITIGLVEYRRRDRALADALADRSELPAARATKN